MIYELITLAIGVLLCLFIHELGHALAARFYGVRVLSVSIGFGPELIGWSDRFGTRWLLTAWPLGGACHFLDQPEKNNERYERGFSNISKWDQAAIYVAGPLFSIALAAIIFVFTGTVDLLSIDVRNSTVPCATLIAGLSLFTGLFSLLPIPPLDGGKLVLLAIDACRSTPLSNAAEDGVFMAGGVILSIASLASTAGLLFHWLH